MPVSNSFTSVNDRRPFTTQSGRRFRPDHCNNLTVSGNKLDTSSSRYQNFATFPRSVSSRGGGGPGLSVEAMNSYQSQTGQISPTCRPLSVQRISESVTNLHINEAQKEILEETIPKQSIGRINRCRSSSNVRQLNLNSSQESISSQLGLSNTKKRRVKREMCRTVEVTRTIVSERRLYKTMSEPSLNVEITNSNVGSSTQTNTVAPPSTLSPLLIAQEKPLTKVSQGSKNVLCEPSSVPSSIANTEIPSKLIPLNTISPKLPIDKEYVAGKSSNVADESFPTFQVDAVSASPSIFLNSETVESAPIKMTPLEMTDLSESIRNFIRDKHLEGPLYHLVINKDDSNKFGFSVSQQSSGLCITRVLPGSPAHKAGMMEGDFLIKINGLPLIKSSNEIIHKILSKHDDVSVVIIRPVTRSTQSNIKPVKTSEPEENVVEAVNIMPVSSSPTIPNTENDSISKLSPPAKPPKLTVSSPSTSPKKSITNIISSFKPGTKKKSHNETHTEDATVAGISMDLPMMKCGSTQELEDETALKELNIHTYSRLKNIYSSIEHMTQSPSATAFYLLQTIHNDNQLIPTLFRILLEIQNHAPQPATNRSKDRDHHLYQIYSTFVHKKAPLNLPDVHSECIEKCIEQNDVDNLEDSLSTISSKLEPIIQSEMKTFVQQMMQDEKLWSSMPECLRIGSQTREEELQAFDLLLKDYFDALRKEAKTKKTATAKYWCLFRIGSYYVDANSLCAHGENADSVSWTLSTDEDTKSITSNYSTDSGTSNASTVSNHFTWLNPKLIPWKAKKGYFRLTKSVKADIRSHHFLAFPLDRPMECEICQGLLWGPESLTLKCQYCGVCIHNNCSHDNLAKCSRRRNDKDKKLSGGNTLMPPNIVDEVVSPSEDQPLMSTLSSSSHGGSSEQMERNHSPKPSVDGKYDLSLHFPEQDVYFQVPESYDARETLAMFPDCKELNDEDSKRLHALAEFEYYIRYTIKQLKIIHLFSHHLWKELVSSNLDPLWKSFSFDSVAELTLLYPALHEIIRSKTNPKTYEPFGDDVLQWLNENEVKLFHLINRYCTSVKNPLIWNEVEKLKNSHDGFNTIFNQYECQRFKMRVKLESIHFVLTIRIDLLLKNIVQKLKKNKFSDEAEVWTKISHWYHRIPVYQNGHIQPLLGTISGSSINEGDLTLVPTFEYFPKQLCPEFLFEHCIAQVNGITAFGGNMNFKMSESRPTLILLFERHLVLLQLEENQRYRLKYYKLRKIEASSNRTFTSTSINMIPIFSTNGLVSRVAGKVINLISPASVSHRIELSFQTEEEAFRLNESIQLHAKSTQDTTPCWKRFFRALDKECASCRNVPPTIMSLTNLTPQVLQEPTEQPLSDTQMQPIVPGGSSFHYPLAQQLSFFDNVSQQFLQGNVTFARMQLYFALTYSKRASSDLFKALVQVNGSHMKETEDVNTDAKDWPNLLTQLLHSSVAIMQGLEDLTCRTVVSDKALDECDEKVNETTLMDVLQRLREMNRVINKFTVQNVTIKAGEDLVASEMHDMAKSLPQSFSSDKLTVDDDGVSILSSTSTQYFDALDIGSVSGETVRDDEVSVEGSGSNIDISRLTQNEENIVDDVSERACVSNSSMTTPTPTRRSSLHSDDGNNAANTLNIAQIDAAVLESVCLQLESDLDYVNGPSATEDPNELLENAAIELVNEVLNNVLPTS